MYAITYERAGKGMRTMRMMMIMTAMTVIIVIARSMLIASIGSISVTRTI